MNLIHSHTHRQDRLPEANQFFKKRDHSFSKQDINKQAIR